MDRLRHGLGLLIAAGLIGCHVKTTADDPSPEPPPPASPAVTPTRVEARDRSLKEHHDRCVEMFVKTEGNGYSRMVVLTHASPNYPKSLELPPDQPELDSAGNPLAPRPAAWVMDKVELVSLLNQEKAGVYAAHGMGRGRPLAVRPKVRDLDGFEGQGVARLQAGEELLVLASPGQTRMLGAIRARPECSRCHDKPAGALLGAFTYVLRPAAGAE